MATTAPPTKLVAKEEPGLPGPSEVLKSPPIPMPLNPPDGVASPVPPVAARAEGRIGGRRLKLTAEQWAQAGRLIAAGES